MNSSTLTTKGQVTIPKRLRDYLGLLPGDKVGFAYTEDGAVRIVAPRAPTPGKSRKKSRFAALRGTRKSGMSTDEIMNLLRGYGDDAGDPGFKAGKSGRLNARSANQRRDQAEFGQAGAALSRAENQ